MVKTAAETAQDIVRRNNEKALSELTTMSPNSRQSLRQASHGNSKPKSAETLNPRKRSQGRNKSPNTKQDKHAKGVPEARKNNSPHAQKDKHGTADLEARKNNSPHAQKDKHGTTDPEAGAAVLGGGTVMPSADKECTYKQKPKRYPDYSGCVVSYTCLLSQRPGHGIVGKCNHAEGTYEVQFTFADNEQPQGQTDSCVPLQFVEEHMVEDEAALAWTTAVARHLLVDSPTSKTTQKLQHLPKTNKQPTSSATITRKTLRINESQANEGPETTPTKSG